MFVDPAAPALLSKCAPPRRALFLDRDGVINVDHGYVHTPERTDFVPGIFELVAAAQEAGWLVIVATNQAGIGRGLYSESTFLEYTRWLHGQFSRRGTPLLATYYCPHHPTAGEGTFRVVCDCRKPAPGMLVSALVRYTIDPTASVLVGDKHADVEAGRAAGLGSSLLLAADVLPDEELAYFHVRRLIDVLDYLRIDRIARLKSNDADGVSEE